MKKTIKPVIAPGTLAKFIASLAAIAGLASSAQADLILSQNFSTDPLNYTLPGNSSPFRFDGSPPRYWALSNTPGLTVNAGIKGADGPYLGTQNLDSLAAPNFSSGSPAQIDFTVSVADFSNLNLSITLAGMPFAEDVNFIRAKTDNDGDGTYETTLFHFKGTASPNNVPYTDSVLGALTAVFQTFPTIPLPAPTAVDGMLRLRLESFNDTDSENEATGIDTILVTGTPAAPAANINTFGPGAGIDQTAKTITWTVPYGTEVTTLGPAFTTSSGATCYDGDPDSGGSVITTGAVRNFTAPVHYWVRSANDGVNPVITNDYTVTVNVTPASSAKNILTFGLPNLPATIAGTTIAWTVPFGTNVTALAPAYTVSQFASGFPASNATVNFSSPQTYTITAQDGSKQDYTVTVTVAPYSQSYAVNYDYRYATASPGDGPYQVTGHLGPGAAYQANWNNIHSPKRVNSGTGGNFDATITDSGGANPITLHTVFGNADGGNDGTGSSGGTTDFEHLFNTGLRLGDVWIRITTDVAPYPGTYDVYVYAWASGKKYGVNAGDTTSWTATGAGNLGAFVENANYKVFAGLSGPLTIFAREAIAGFSIVNTAPQLTPFQSWAQTNITAIDAQADATETGDPDGDHSTNIAEFAFHGNPLSAADHGFQRVAIEDTDADTLKELTLTLAVRNLAGAPVFAGSPSPTASVDGITYTIQGSLDLAVPNSAVSETSAPSGLPILPTGWEYRRFRLDASEGLPGKGFLRAKVTQP